MKERAYKNSERTGNICRRVGNIQQGKNKRRMCVCRVLLVKIGSRAEPSHVRQTKKRHGRGICWWCDENIDIVITTKLWQSKLWKDGVMCIITLLKIWMIERTQWQFHIAVFIKILLIFLVVVLSKFFHSSSFTQKNILLLTFYFERFLRFIYKKQ